MVRILEYMIRKKGRGNCLGNISTPLLLLSNTNIEQPDSRDQGSGRGIRDKWSSFSFGESML